MNNADPVVIVSAARTPMGAFQGQFSSLSATDLGAHAIRAAVERAGLPPEQVQEVLMGCVLPAGLGQAPARQAALKAGLPLSAACTTIGKVCGSGMKATMLAHDLLVAGAGDILVAGGMESMTNAPYLLPKARGGQRLGHGQMLDHMFFDGLEDRYAKETAGRLMGTFAEDCASAHSITRAEQDAYAVESALRARNAAAERHFDWEISTVKVASKGGEVLVQEDEPPARIDVDKVPHLKPAFRADGTVTAASSSSIADGAAALVLTRQSTARQRGLQPIARIVAHASHAIEPALFPTAPVGASQRVLAQCGWHAADVDAWEINEAFAVVPMTLTRQLELDPARVNVHGGACALGHPIGASGARILVTLLGVLRRRGGSRGVATLCIGGGEATAMAVELL